MLRRFCAVVALCAFALSVTAAEARKAAQEPTHCAEDNSGRQVCPYPENRIQSHGSGIVGHPEGCPRVRFCGCGVSVKVFGKPVRGLYLAANWLKFPRANPGPGMVAARRGHVFLILSYNGDGTALAYDPNSGGRKTRIHVRSLAGYKVVNPHDRVASR